MLGNKDTDIQKWKQVYYVKPLSDATNSPSIFLIPSEIWDQTMEEKYCVIHISILNSIFNHS